MLRALLFSTLCSRRARSASVSLRGTRTGGAGGKGACLATTGAGFSATAGAEGMGAVGDGPGCDMCADAVTGVEAGCDCCVGCAWGVGSLAATDVCVFSGAAYENL